MVSRNKDNDQHDSFHSYSPSSFHFSRCFSRNLRAYYHRDPIETQRTTANKIRFPLIPVKLCLIRCVHLFALFNPIYRYYLKSFSLYHIKHTFPNHQTLFIFFCLLYTNIPIFRFISGVFIIRDKNQHCYKIYNACYWIVWKVCSVFDGQYILLRIWWDWKMIIYCEYLSNNEILNFIFDFKWSNWKKRASRIIE